MTTVFQVEAAPPGMERAGLTIGSLAETIEALVGSAVFIDPTFPGGSVAGTPTLEATRLLQLPRPAIETRFLQRFRQSGGHVPVATIDLNDELTWPPQLSDKSNRVVMSFETVNAAMDAGKRLRASKIAMLCPALPDEVQESKSGNRSRGYRCVRLIDCNGGPSYLLFLPSQARSGGASGGAPMEIAAEVDEVTFSSEGLNVDIEARSMIHDGGYVSEGDVKYSWLWTGPSTHFRLILPQIAGVRPRLAELCIPRTEEETNLDRLAVQLDGRAIKHRLDRWSATSGKVSVDIPRSTDYSVLTLIVPAPTHDAESGRLLGVCLDKLILTP